MYSNDVVFSRVAYFTCPKEFLKKDYEDAEFSTVRIVFKRMWMSNLDSFYVEISPTRFNAEEDGYEDYDYQPFDISEEDFYEFQRLAKEYEDRRNENACNE